MMLSAIGTYLSITVVSTSANAAIVSTIVTSAQLRVKMSTMDQESNGKLRCVRAGTGFRTRQYDLGRDYTRPCLYGPLACQRDYRRRWAAAIAGRLLAPGSWPTT